MTPSARVQAAIEILDEIVAAGRDAGPAADTVIARYFKARRYAGSKDRRAVRELAYRAIRRAGERPDSGRAAMLGLAADDPALALLFDGGPHAPAPPAAGEAAAPAGLAPVWLQGRFDPLIDDAELAALLERAPLDVRVNRLKGDMDAAARLLPKARRTPLSPLGLRLPDGFDVERHPAWLEGLVEVQDEGSQWLALAADPRPGMTVVDLCAGAGGKTLALAAEMANAGTIVAADTDRGRLSRLRPRAERAGATIADARLLAPGNEMAALDDMRGAADLILVDAPCSGTGTWRRNPETRWRLDAARLARLVSIQARLLDIAAELVRPGGRIAYAVCSLLGEEGREQAAAFGGRSGLVPEAPGMAGGRRAGCGTLLTPAQDGTDGFFIALWRAPC